MFMNKCSGECDPHIPQEMEICRSSKRLKNTLEETQDFISELPDTILVHILSFLPTEDALKTSFLRSFGNLWCSIPVIELNECFNHECGVWKEYENTRFADIIRHVCNPRDVDMLALDKLSLRFQFALVFSKIESASHDPEIESLAEMETATAGHLDELLSYVINKKIKILDLNFMGCSTVSPEEFYVSPDVFRSDCLTDLRLAGCDVKSWGEISLKALRVLLLSMVSLSDKVMENILLGCPFLEELSLIDCYGLRKLYCSNPDLKKLMLTLNTNQRMLQVSCPHVTSLEIAGWIEHARLLDVSSLIDASISFSYFKPALRLYGTVPMLLLKISRCKTFTPCNYTMLMLTIWSFIGMPCAPFQWKNLIIKLYLTKWHHPGLSWLLKSCHSLETLTLYIHPGSDNVFMRQASNWILAHDFDGESYWDLQEASFPYLKSVIVHGYINEPFVIQMLKFLLRTATKLQKMVLSMGEAGRQNDQFTSENLQEFVQELSTFPRASSQAMIYVS